jgi:cob(I)alamin adenosyltransferase
MEIETPPLLRDTPKPTGERRGLVIVHTGTGKGKSTAAFGLALRAHGRGKAVKVYQFMKVPTARFGEHRLFDQLGIPITGLRYGWIPLEPVLACLRERPPHVHVVLTGRGAPAEMIELADTVTEMTLIKHHFKAGVPAQRGIED